MLGPAQINFSNLGSEDYEHHSFDPFRDLRTLQDEVNRLFSTNLSRSFGDEGIARGAWTPNVDIYENKDQIVLEAELPGMNREDFELTVEK